MTEGLREREEAEGEEPVEAIRPGRALYGLTPELEEAVGTALDEDRPEAARALLAALHPADIADLLQRLDAEPRARLVDAMRDTFDPEVLAWLGEREREEVVERLSPDRVAAAIAVLDTDDALVLLEALEPAGQRAVLRALDAPDRALLEQGLEFPEDSAGRLMQREVVAVPPHWSVGQVIDYLRSGSILPDAFYSINVVDPRHRPIGTIALARLLRSSRPMSVTEIMEREFHRITVATHQEEVANLFRRYGLVSAPVVSEAGRLVGVVTVDDVVAIISEEAGEDILHLGGVSETGIFRPIRESVFGRFNWLFVNLITAFVAAAVIGLFEETIAKIVALAVLNPIVAGQGGNAGTQTLTVVVRAIATREIGLGDGWRILRREGAIGLINGLLFALITGAIAAGWFHDWRLALVIGAAMIINLLAAGLAGSLIPLALEKLGFDPAIASAVFLTTVTDCVGFFSFLGLATLFLL
jgi:magnesium transporter